jgi:hypothetical protein
MRWTVGNEVLVGRIKDKLRRARSSYTSDDLSDWKVWLKGKETEKGGILELLYTCISRNILFLVSLFFSLLSFF